MSSFCTDILQKKISKAKLLLEKSLAKHFYTKKLLVKFVEIDTLMPVKAPGSMSPRTKRMERRTQGIVAVTHTTFPDDLTPLKSERQRQQQTMKTQKVRPRMGVPTLPMPSLSWTWSTSRLLEIRKDNDFNLQEMSIVRANQQFRTLRMSASKYYLGSSPISQKSLLKKRKNSISFQKLYQYHHSII